MTQREPLTKAALAILRDRAEGGQVLLPQEGLALIEEVKKLRSTNSKLHRRVQAIESKYERGVPAQAAKEAVADRDIWKRLARGAQERAEAAEQRVEAINRKCEVCEEASCRCLELRMAQIQGMTTRIHNAEQRVAELEKERPFLAKCFGCNARAWDFTLDGSREWVCRLCAAQAAGKRQAEAITELEVQLADLAKRYDENWITHQQIIAARQRAQQQAEAITEAVRLLRDLWAYSVGKHSCDEVCRCYFCTHLGPQIRVLLAQHQPTADAPPAPCSSTCSRHVSHPCEKCGQQWGPRAADPPTEVAQKGEQDV